MSKYYEVIGTIDGQDEVLFGSFLRSDCLYELDADRWWYQAEGYKGLTIKSRLTSETPDPEVYA